ncbi:Triose-phosphate Transporter [Ascosphaera pollenicola]|nr:Triose-phosphate Transporter [Ascosphaera pollenicola]
MGRRSSFNDRARASTDSAAARQQLNPNREEPLSAASASPHPSPQPHIHQQDGRPSPDISSEVHGDQADQRPNRSLFDVPRHNPNNRSASSLDLIDHRQSTDHFSSTSRDSVEMSALSDEEIGLMREDEEAGLTAKERRQRARLRRQQRRELDARIDTNISDDGKRAADRHVVKRLAINVVLILLWYFFSLSISVYNKWMFSSEHLNFEYPLFTTSLHMAVQFTLATTIIYLWPSLRPGGLSPSDGRPMELKQLISRQFYLTRLVPCGTATSLDIGLGNMSMRFITLTFVTMCKSSALAFVLLFAFLFGLETMSLKLVLIIATMTVGVIMMVAGETAFNAIGFSLIIASAFFSGFRWGLTQILLLRHPATSNPFATLFLLTPIMFVSLVIISSFVEGPLNILQGLKALMEATGTFPTIGLLIFPGVLAFCMIASEFALLKRSSVVTLSICGIFKEVVTISAAGAIFDDSLTAVNLAGLAVTIASIASYNYMKIARMRREARMDLVEERVEDTGTDDDDDDTDSWYAQSSTNGLLAVNSSNFARISKLPKARNII